MKQVGSITTEAGRQATSAAGKQIRLCFVPDIPNWAFDNTARQLARRLGHGVHTSFVYADSFEHPADLIRQLFAGEKKYDIVLFFWRGMYAELFSPQTLLQTVEGMSKDQIERFVWNISRTVKTTSVYDHIELDQQEESVRINHALPHADTYFVSSEILNNLYSSLPDIPAPSHILRDAVDLDMFKPCCTKTTTSSKTTKIGWAGNSAWGLDGIDHKGLNTIIAPAVEKLKREGYDVDGLYCDRKDFFTPHEKMSEYYQRIDIFTCASLNEGTPNPVLEAMASGLPILSTDVGVVSEAFGPLQKEFIVQDRESPEYFEKLKRLVTEPELRSRLSCENLESIKAWSWDKRIEEWHAFFAYAHSLSDNLKDQIRQKDMLQHFIDTGIKLRTETHLKDIFQYRMELAHVRLGTLSHRIASLVVKILVQFTKCAQRLMPGKQQK